MVKNMCKPIILNITQHIASKEQVEAGVIDLKDSDRQKLSELLTFNSIPSYIEMRNRAKEIIKLIENYQFDFVMVGGAPFFLNILCLHLLNHDITPLFAFSKRKSVEEIQEDGSVIKKSVFKHLGFVPYFT